MQELLDELSRVLGRGVPVDDVAGRVVAHSAQTDDITVAQVAERVAASAGLTLAPNTDGPLRGRLRRTWTSVKHIRFD